MKNKTPSEKYPLHFEYVQYRFGFSSEEYDRIFGMKKKIDGILYGPVILGIQKRSENDRNDP